MKAAVLIKKGSGEEAFEIKELPIPELAPDEVLIKVDYFGLNYADVMARRGMYRDAPQIPSVLGYEVVGVVEKAGSIQGQGIRGKRVVAFTRFGGYAEYAKTKVFACAEIGELDGPQATAVAVQYATAYYMAYDAIRLNEGDKVMIHAGAGGVGTALIQLCKLAGCTVFANAGSDDKLGVMRNLGADHVMNYRSTDYLHEMKKVLNGAKLQAVFNPIGGSSYKKDMALLGAGGRVMLFGGAERSGKSWGILSDLNFVRKMGFMLPIKLMMVSKGVIGVNMLRIGDEQPEVLKRCMNGVIALLKEEKIKPQVGAIFSFNEIGRAHDLLESRKSIGKIVIKIES